MKKILILLPHYLPGTRYGGPVRTIANLVEQLGTSQHFRILTTNHDLGDPTPYALPHGKWLQQKHCQVFYSEDQSFSFLKNAINDESPDLLYLNSFFHFRMSILPSLILYFKSKHTMRLLIAVRGEFNPGALKIKSLKKRIFLTIAKCMGLYKSVEWQASTATEAMHINSLFGKHAKIHIVPNLSSTATPLNHDLHKETGKLRVLFLGRISPMKNLDFLLNRISEAGGHISLSIVGPIEDLAYWKTCQLLIDSLPDTVDVKYLGEVQPEGIPAVLSSHDLLALTTKGENYGHVIVEAFQHALPVLISDRTPWRQLDQKNAGWDFPLDQPEAFNAQLSRLRDMDQKTWLTYSQGAAELGSSIQNDPKILEQNRLMLEGDH